jgi:hypothetical protein
VTRFLDGPAAGVTLFLQRAPLFLRAVRVAGGKWDALDQLDDYPKPNEEIVVYALEGAPTWMHVHRRGGGGIYRGGAYRVVEPQPADADLRDVFKWRAWAQARSKERTDAVMGD